MYLGCLTYFDQPFRGFGAEAAVLFELDSIQQTTDRAAVYSLVREAVYSLAWSLEPAQFRQQAWPQFNHRIGANSGRM